MGTKSSRPVRHAPTVPTGAASEDAQGRSGYPMYDHVYKVVVMGAADTGKSCCVEKFVGSDVFHTTYIPTIGVDFKFISVKLDDVSIRLQLWETAGHETFRTLSEMFYRNSHGLVAVYDVTRRNSFDAVPHWIEKARRQGPPDAPVMLVGNKCDKTAIKEVDYETAREFADQHNFLFFEISAKDGVNTELALMSLVALIRHKEECQPQR